MATDTLAPFRKMLDHLTQVSEGLKSLDQIGLPLGTSNGHRGAAADAEAAKAAAWRVAALATEVARDAVQLCNRFDPEGGPARPRRRWWSMKKRVI